MLISKCKPWKHHESSPKIFSLLGRDELQIGGIFIRIYNDMPTYPIAQPKLFIMDLLEYLKHAYQFLQYKKNPTAAAAAAAGTPKWAAMAF